MNFQFSVDVPHETKILTIQEKEFLVRFSHKGIYQPSLIELDNKEIVVPVWNKWNHANDIGFQIDLLRLCIIDYSIKRGVCLAENIYEDELSIVPSSPREWKPFNNFRHNVRLHLHKDFFHRATIKKLRQMRRENKLHLEIKFLSEKSTRWTVVKVSSGNSWSANIALENAIKIFSKKEIGEAVLLGLNLGRDERTLYSTDRGVFERLSVHMSDSTIKKWVITSFCKYNHVDRIEDLLKTKSLDFVL
jgi:hypothetical protein